MKTLGNMSGGNKLTSFRYTKKNISVIGKSKFCIHITLENKHNPIRKIPTKRKANPKCSSAKLLLFHVYIVTPITYVFPTSSLAMSFL